jgi:hypothetical protein
VDIHASGIDQKPPIRRPRRLYHCQPQRL